MKRLALLIATLAISSSLSLTACENREQVKLETDAAIAALKTSYEQVQAAQGEVQ
ncbi:MAG: hypothetical protein AB4426_24050 [Xenococcaceae cyanobacterium]